MFNESRLHQESAKITDPDSRARRIRWATVATCSLLDNPNL